MSREYGHGYSYTANGNLMSKNMESVLYNGQGGVAESKTDSWLYAYTNHAAVSIDTSAGAKTFEMEYDAVGNMVYQKSPKSPLNPPKGDFVKNMQYDSYNRIRKVTDGNGNAVGEYWYDDQGFRVKKIAKREINKIDRYVEVLYPSMYFGLERQKNVDGTSIENTAYAVNNIFLDGVRIAAVIPSGDAQYYLTDQVDSVKVVVDDEGLPVSRMEYLPYGETWFEEGNTNNAPKYNSQELDKETGYYFYNARHYDPQVSRFVTPDTVIDGEYSTQGWNGYSYTKGNPIRYKDPTGHYGEDVHFDLMYFLARKAGCSKESSNTIAKANQYVDDNPETQPVTSNEKQRRDFHFADEKRVKELKEKALTSKDEKDIGTYLHVKEDTYSHSEAIKKGNSYHKSKDVDKTYYDPRKSENMAKTTFNNLKEIIGTNAQLSDQDEEVIKQYVREKDPLKKKEILEKCLGEKLPAYNPKDVENENNNKKPPKG